LAEAIGVATYSKNDGTLEIAATIADHSSIRTPQLYARRPDDAGDRRQPPALAAPSDCSGRSRLEIVDLDRAAGEGRGNVQLAAHRCDQLAAC
jgi:hypothetical protein